MEKAASSTSLQSSSKCTIRTFQGNIPAVEADIALFVPYTGLGRRGPLTDRHGKRVSREEIDALYERCLLDRHGPFVPMEPTSSTGS
jgi:hypothetical protein